MGEKMVFRRVRLHALVQAGVAAMLPVGVAMSATGVHGAGVGTVVSVPNFDYAALASAMARGRARPTSRKLQDDASTNDDDEPTTTITGIFALQQYYPNIVNLATLLENSQFGVNFTAGVELELQSAFATTLTSTGTTVLSDDVTISIFEFVELDEVLKAGTLTQQNLYSLQANYTVRLDSADNVNGNEVRDRVAPGGDKNEEFLGEVLAGYGLWESVSICPSDDSDTNVVCSTLDPETAPSSWADDTTANVTGILSIDFLLDAALADAVESILANNVAQSTLTSYILVQLLESSVASILTSGDTTVSANDILISILTDDGLLTESSIFSFRVEYTVMLQAGDSVDEVTDWAAPGGEKNDEFLTELKNHIEDQSPLSKVESISICSNDANVGCPIASSGRSNLRGAGGSLTAAVLTSLVTALLGFVL